MAKNEGFIVVTKKEEKREEKEVREENRAHGSRLVQSVKGQ